MTKLEVLRLTCLSLEASTLAKNYLNSILVAILNVYIWPLDSTIKIKRRKLFETIDSVTYSVF